MKPSAYFKTSMFCERAFHFWHQSIWPLNFWCQESFRQSLLSGSKISDLQLYTSDFVLLTEGKWTTWRCLAMLSRPDSQWIIWAHNHHINTGKSWQVFYRASHPGRAARIPAHTRPVQMAPREWGDLCKHKTMGCSPLCLCYLFKYRKKNTFLRLRDLMDISST